MSAALAAVVRWAPTDRDRNIARTLRILRGAGLDSTYTR